MAAETNVGQKERIGSTALGAALLLPVLKKRSALSWTAAAVGGALMYRGVSGHCSFYSALGVNTDGAGSAPVEVKQAITIGKPADELHALWREPEAFTRIMRDFARLTPLDRDHARWQVTLADGHEVEWETEVVEERPGELFHWRSVEGSKFPNEGKLQFSMAEGDRGTVATLTVQFDPTPLPAGTLLKAASQAFPSASRAAVLKMLRNFKSLAETGEIPTLAYNVSARANDGRKGDLL